MDHRAAFKAEAARVRTYRRQLSLTADRPKADDDPRLDLEICLNASLAIIDEHLDAWLTEQGDS